MNRPILTAALLLALPLTAAPARAPLAPVYTDPHVVPPEVGPAPIALLVDFNSGQTLYSKEPDRRFMPASLTKVMTLYVAFEMIKRGQLNPNAVTRMSEDAFKHWHAVGSTMFLDRQHDVTVHELLMGIANVSANDACVVLAEAAAGSVPNWLALMNAEARKLGMKNSHFGTPNGWMDEGQTYITARDYVTLASAILSRHPDLYHEYIGRQTMTWNGITQHNHDPILGKLEGADGIKTGFTNQAGYGFIGSAERGGRRLIMVLASVDRHQDRAKAAAALMDWGFAAFDSRALFAAGTTVGEARVQDGAAASVPLVAPGNYAATAPKGAAGPIKLRVVYDGPLKAPIARGTPVASLEIRVGGSAPSRVPLLAGADVARAGLFDRLLNGLRGLVS
ncbi:D-alanyl-D-alanine carboxypeptidase family protein [Novosphingobium flavum]|uniref:D-alanyl-D-alanine carboxypeptidase family protein n=1 Tax=Novosphingobium flavum TaxID=1778672 RepID=UPI001FE3EFBE|nr:D-alanyl-D-alanine carboxypeptidase family protein [Novosphingobium flavum]